MASDRAMGLLNALVIDDDGRRWGERATDVQREDARALLDLKGPRRHWIGRSRGYSKTDDLAAVTVAVLVTQLRAADEAIGCAADRDQARILVDRIRGIAQRTPELQGALDVGAYDVRTRDGARFEAMAANASSAWGRSPSWVVVDELAQWGEAPNAKGVWQAVSTAVPKRRGRLAIITTAGDPSHWSRDIYQYALGDSLWRVSETHGPAPWLDPAELASERRRLPESAWQRFFENRWTATEDRLLTLEDLQAAALLPGRLEPEPGQVYVLGVDLAVRGDNAVVAVCHCEQVEGYGDRRVVVDSLDVFTPTRHAETDLQAVEGCVQARSRQYGYAPAMFDPAQGFQMMQRLRAAGLTVLEHTFTAQSNSRRALLILELVRGRRLWLPDDPETVAEFAAVRLRETSPGVYRYDHDSGKHDDRVTAISLAAVHLLEAPVVGSGAPVFGATPARSVHDITGDMFGPRPVAGYREIPRSGIASAEWPQSSEADYGPPPKFLVDALGLRVATIEHQRIERQKWQRARGREQRPEMPTRSSTWRGAFDIDNPAGSNARTPGGSL